MGARRRGLVWVRTVKYGVDVSSLQGRIDWNAERTRNDPSDFVIVRAGLGNELPDSRAHYNVQAARAAGFVVGTYDVVYPLRHDEAHPNRDPVDQARFHGTGPTLAGDL